MVIYGWTGVFWDMHDYPLPYGTDVELFVEMVHRSLNSHGIQTEVEFFAYGSGDDFDYLRYLEDQSFTADKVVDKPTRFYRLLHNMAIWVSRRQDYGGAKNLLVILKGIPGEDNDTMIDFLDKMIDRGYNVFTVVPEDCARKDFEYPEPIQAWRWSSLCCGGVAIDLSAEYPSSDDDDDDDDDSGSSSPETHRAQGVKRGATETDAGSATATKRLQTEADSQKN